MIFLTLVFSPIPKAAKEKHMRLDWWLVGICATRALGGMVFVTCAAALPVLQQEWGLSASAAGSVASGW